MVYQEFPEATILSDSGASLYFLSFIAQRPPTDKNQIYMILNQGGEAWQLTNHKPGVRRIYWAPDGKSIYFLANDPKTKEEEKKDKLKDDVYA